MRIEIVENILKDFLSLSIDMQIHFKDYTYKSMFKIDKMVKRIEKSLNSYEKKRFPKLLFELKKNMKDALKKHAEYEVKNDAIKGTLENNLKHLKGKL